MSPCPPFRWLSLMPCPRADRLRPVLSLGSLWDKCRMPQDCCHFPGPRPTPCLTVSLTLPPACREGSFPFGLCSSRWRPGGVLVHFPSAIPKQSTFMFLSESISSRISAYPSQVMQRAEASWAPVPPQYFACGRCPAPQLQPPPRQLQHPAKSRRLLLTCSAS